MSDQTVSVGEHPTIILLNKHRLKLLLKFLYICRSVHLSHVIREVSLCSGQGLMQKLTTVKLKEIRVCVVLSHKCGICSTAPPWS